LFGLLWLLMFSPKRRLTLAQLRELAARHGFPDPDLAAAIAMAESGLRGTKPLVADAYAHGDVTRGHSIGLWQINLRAHPEFNAVSLFDPDYNARAAFAVSRGGTNWTPWSTFNQGLYKPFMPSKGAEPNA
jgi:Lysozyme like domain